MGLFSLFTDRWLGRYTHTPTPNHPQESALGEAWGLFLPASGEGTRHEMRDKLSLALVEFLKKGVFVRKTEKSDLGEIEHVT